MLKKLPAPVSHETVRALEKLLADARSGNILGVAYVALGPRGAYVADAVGLAYADPIRTRGTLFALAAKLEDITIQRSL